MLENDDIALASIDLIGNRLPKLLAKRTDAPDEIYPRGDAHEPLVGMAHEAQRRLLANRGHAPMEPTHLRAGQIADSESAQVVP